MKKFFGVLALTFALLGTSAYAQGADQKDCCKQQKACCKEQKACCKTKTDKGDEYTNTKPGCGDSCTNACNIKGGACKCGAACMIENTQAKPTKNCCKKDGEAKKCDKQEAKTCNKDKKACDKQDKACDKSKKCDKKDGKDKKGCCKK